MKTCTKCGKSGTVTAAQNNKSKSNGDYKVTTLFKKKTKSSNKVTKIK